MSAAASRWAWDARGVTPTQKLVLVCLADHAGKDGANCWPSVSRVADECCLSERAVQYALRQLQELGFVNSEHRAGKSTNYSLPVDGVQEMHPAPDAPLQEMRGRGARDAGEGCKRCTQNHKEPPKNQKKGAKRKNGNSLDLSILPPGIPDDLWADFVAVREKKKKPLTNTALKMLAGQLRECEGAGVSAADALSLAVERAWTTVKLDWVKNAAGGNSQPEDEETRLVRKQLEDFDRQLAERTRRAEH